MIIDVFALLLHHKITKNIICLSLYLVHFCLDNPNEILVLYHLREKTLLLNSRTMNKKKLQKLLVKALRTKNEKDRQAFQTCIYEESFELLFVIIKKRFPNRAEDVLSDLFCDRLFVLPLGVYENAIDHLTQFLIRCTINFCNSKYKKESKRQILNKFYENIHKSKSSSIMLTATEITMDLTKALQKIPERQEKVFLLHCYFGYKHTEIVRMSDDIDSNPLSRTRQHDPNVIDVGWLW